MTHLSATTIPDTDILAGAISHNHNNLNSMQVHTSFDRAHARIDQAGIALQGLMHHMEFRLLSNEELAEKAFDIAEAMIKEAEKRGMRFY